MSVRYGQSLPLMVSIEVVAEMFNRVNHVQHLLGGAVPTLAVLQHLTAISDHPFSTPSCRAAVRLLLPVHSQWHYNPQRTPLHSKGRQTQELTPTFLSEL